MKRFRLMLALSGALLFASVLPFSFMGCSNPSGDDNAESTLAANPETGSGKTKGTTAEKGAITLKEFSLSVLIDGEEITEDSTLENEAPKTLSFAYADSENGTAEGLPSVSAKWEVVSGARYVLLSATEGKEIQIADTNYSDFVQPVNIRLTVTPEKATYKTATVTVKLNASVLAKKDIAAAILYDGENVTEKPILKSARDVLLSYSLGSENASEIGASAKWEFESGLDYAAGSDSDRSLKISNMNCSGESQDVTVKLTLTPSNWAYKTTSASITFTAEDSTADIQPGQFSASVALNRTSDYAGSEDGTVRISWTESKNAKNYYVYRDEKQIACITGELYYLDDFSPDISDISSNGYNVTYRVKAENLGLSSESEPVDFYVGGLVPSSKASNVYAIPLKDSDGYYGVNITWESNDYHTFEVYRLVSSPSSASADEIVKNGKVCFGNYDDYKYNSSKSICEWTFWDYNVLDEISSSKPYAHYTVVTIKTYKSPNNYIRLRSEPSGTYRASCGYLAGKPNKWTDQEETWSSGSSSSGSSSSSTSGSLSLSASKRIVYNRYAYCKLTFTKVSGAKSYKIYRCVRRSNNFGSVKASDCVYIGSTAFTSYVDDGVCNQYLWENTSSVGKYFYYMYYYVVTEDSSGKTYTSAIVRAN